MRRVLCWFSCGTASAVATKRTLVLIPDAIPVNCDTRASEDSDNYRFSAECERWFGVPITYIKSEDYQTVDEVFDKTRYMAGINGARCTTELKKIPRLKFANPDDTHVFGFCADEKKRISAFKQRNPDLILKFTLQELGLTKEDCYREIREAGIQLPRMNLLGFDNNNCPGCVKASSPWYWSMIRKHYPEAFKRRCEQSRKLGVRLVQINSERIFLDELPNHRFRKIHKENLSCGPECGSQGVLFQ